MIYILLIVGNLQLKHIYIYYQTNKKKINALYSEKYIMKKMLYVKYLKN